MLTVAAALVIVSVLLASRLDQDAGIGTLVDRDSSTAEATATLHRTFGDEPIVVLVEARRRGCPGGRDCRLTDIVLTPDLLRVLSLEGCLAGNVPRGAKLPAPVCRRFGRDRPFLVVNGPATFVNESARQVAARIGSPQSAAAAERAARAARKVAAAKGLSEAEQRRLGRRARELALLNALEPALRFGLGPGGPAAADPTFVHQLVFEPRLGFDVPKTRFAHLFPGPTSALIELRPRAGLEEDQRRELIELVERAVSSPSFRLASAEYAVAELPVTSDGVASSVERELLILLLAALLLVGGGLALFARARPMGLAPASALCATAATFGLMSLLGASLTIASLALLPLLIGIGTALATRFHGRVDELLGSRDAASAVEVAARTEAPLLLASALAGSVGLLALVLAPVPMLRSFGGFLALGTALSAVLTLTVGAALARLAAEAPRVPGSRVARSVGRLGSVARSSFPARLRPASWRRLPRSVTRAVGRAASVVPAAGRRLFVGASRSPGRVLAIGVVLAGLGAAIGMRGEEVADLRTIGPSKSPAAERAQLVRRDAGRAGDLHVLVTAHDVTAPRVVAWMSRYQRRVLARHGYSEDRRCRAAELCPALSPVSLLGSAAERQPAETRRLLNALGPNVRRSVLSPDRGTANMTFSIKQMPLDRQADVVEDLRSQLDPPAGVTARVAGAPALAGDVAGSLQSSEGLTLAALAALFVVLLALQRRPRITAASLLTLALAAGWSALLLALLGIELTPMSAGLGVLVTALSASLVVVPLTVPHAGPRPAGGRRAAGGGHDPRTAVKSGYERTNHVILATVLTGAGLAALVASDTRMLREFGALAALDLALVATGVALVLPAALVLAERLTRARLPRSRAEAAAVIRHRAAGVRTLARRLRSLAASVRRAAPRLRRGKQLEP